jgi:hypothetical protein
MYFFSLIQLLLFLLKPSHINDGTNFVENNFFSDLLHWKNRGSSFIASYNVNISEEPQE